MSTTAESVSTDLSAARPPFEAVRRARWAVLITFLIVGIGMASWIPHIPAVQRELDLSEGVLGFALLGAPVGSLTAMLSSSWLMAHFGSQLVTRGAGLVFCLGLSLPVLAPSLPALIASLYVVGAGLGVLDIGMNVQAVAVEKRYARPIMSTFHGLYSVGGLAGAGLAALVISLGVEKEPHVVTTSLILAGVAIVSSRALLPRSADESGGGPAFVRPTRPILWLGLIIFCVALGEGAVADWSAVYLRNTLETSAGYAAAGFAAFSATMAIGRLLGDRIVASIGPARVMRISGLIVAVGLAFALLTGSPLAGVIGFGCAGIGLAGGFPIVLSASGQVPGTAPAAALAAVATIGYTGFLVGPPLIGLIAEVTSLRLSLGLLIVLGLVIAVFAQRVEPEP